MLMLPVLPVPPPDPPTLPLAIAVAFTHSGFDQRLQLLLEQQLRIIESYNCFVWKGLLRSSSVNLQLSLLWQLNLAAGEKVK